VSRRVVSVHHASVVQLSSSPQSLPTTASAAQSPPTATTASIPTVAAPSPPASPATAPPPPPSHVERQERLARPVDGNCDARTVASSAAFAAAARVPVASVSTGDRRARRRRAAANAAATAAESEQRTACRAQAQRVQHRRTDELTRRTWTGDRDLPADNASRGRRPGSPVSLDRESDEIQCT